MLISETIRVALSALRANKLRSLLTMLGIVIGVAVGGVCYAWTVATGAIIAVEKARIVATAICFIFSVISHSLQVQVITSSLGHKYGLYRVTRMLPMNQSACHTMSANVEVPRALARASAYAGTTNSDCWDVVS